MGIIGLSIVKCSIMAAVENMLTGTENKDSVSFFASSRGYQARGGFFDDREREENYS